MAEINQIQCQTLYPNAGVGLCGYTPAPLKYVIYIPTGDIIDAAGAGSIQTYIQGKLIANLRTGRWFVFGPVAEMADNGQDISRETLPSGQEFVTRGKTGVWLFDLAGGTSCTQKNLAQFDQTNKLYQRFYVDTNFVLLGQSATDSTGAPAVGGFSPYGNYVHPYKMPGYDAVVRYQFEDRYLDPKSDQLSMVIVDLKSASTFINWNTIFETYAVQNVNQTDVSPSGHAAGVFTVAFYGSCGNDNLATRFKTAMATSGAFVVTNAATGAAITVTSVALNAAQTAVVFTLDTTDTDYPSAGGKISIQLNTVSALAALTQPMKYYESLPFTVTV